jgi:hypothetical protein
MATMPKPEQRDWQITINRVVEPGLVQEGERLLLHYSLFSLCQILSGVPKGENKSLIKDRA